MSWSSLRFLGTVHGSRGHGCHESYWVRDAQQMWGVFFRDLVCGWCFLQLSTLWDVRFLNNLPKILGQADGCSKNVCFLACILAVLLGPGLERETLQRVFNVLDPTETGWVAGVELTYLEAGEKLEFWNAPFSFPPTLSVWWTFCFDKIFKQDETLEEAIFWT